MAFPRGFARSDFRATIPVKSILLKARDEQLKMEKRTDIMIQRFHVVRRLSKKETWPITAIKDCTVCLRRELLKSWEI